MEKTTCPVLYSIPVKESETVSGAAKEMSPNKESPQHEFAKQDDCNSENTKRMDTNQTVEESKVADTKSQTSEKSEVVTDSPMELEVEEISKPADDDTVPEDDHDAAVADDGNTDQSVQNDAGNREDGKGEDAPTPDPAVNAFPKDAGFTSEKFKKPQQQFAKQDDCNSENTKSIDINQTVEESKVADTESQTSEKSEVVTDSPTALEVKEISKPADDDTVTVPEDDHDAAVADNGNTDQSVQNDAGNREDGKGEDAPTPDLAVDAFPKDAGFTSEKFKKPQHKFAKQDDCNSENTKSMDTSQTVEESKVADTESQTSEKSEVVTDSPMELEIEEISKPADDDTVPEDDHDAAVADDGNTEQSVQNDAGNREDGTGEVAPAPNLAANACPRDAGFTSEKFKKPQHEFAKQDDCNSENTKSMDTSQTVEESKVADTESQTSEKSEVVADSPMELEVEEISKPADDDTVPEDDHDAVADDGNTEQSVQNDAGNREDGTGEVAPAPDQAANACPRDAGFTSEKFKIEISELPKKFGFGQLRKRLSVTLGLRPHKLKALPTKSFAFVCFSSVEDRDQALQVINGHVWKGKTLTAKKAQPAADPMKRKLEESSENAENTKRSKLDNTLPPAVSWVVSRLRSCVEPLWEVNYPIQLQRKTEKARKALKAVAHHGDVRKQFTKAREENNGMCCALEPIIPSPVMEGYRNKSEFSIGRSEDGSETVVGFRFGLYKDGTDCVGSPSQVSIISPDSKKVVESFEKFVRQSRYPPFNHRTHCGHWRQLTVRTTREGGGTLATAEFVVNGATKDEVDVEKEALHRHFTEGEGKGAGVTTFFFRPCSAKTSNSISEEPYELIYGDGHIHETMGDMKFRISPSAFFQVNTAAAEVLYKHIADWCNVSPTTTILDICCGTGTIGQSMAKNVARVVGIEMCKEAIEDAQSNASLNGVTNVTYHCAKVEHVISDIIRNVGSDPVAVLDPPRGGMHPSVIKSLRKCHSLNRIVYAACNPAGAKSNFIDLCRPKSRKTRGQPFKFVRAVPLDMFPSTMHFELLVLFERVPEEQNSNSSDSE